MIKKAIIVNTPTSETPDAQYLCVEFTDGSFVNLNEEELKNAAELAKGTHGLDAGQVRTVTTAIQERLAEWENEDD